MYSYSQVLIRNICLGLLFSISVALISALIFTNYLENEQAQQSKTIRAIAQQISSVNENKALVRTLKNIAPFALLDISLLTGDELFHNENYSERSIFSFLLPKKENIILKDQNIHISFQINHNQEITLLVQLLIVFFVATMIFCLVAAVLSIKRYKNLYLGISQQIKKELSLVVHNGESSVDNLFNISALKDGVSEIKSLIKSQQSSSLAFEHQAFTDNLTQLNNRNKFVHFFENKVSETGEVKHGVLLITRCSELQTINQIRGFSDGDRYISRVATIMRSALNTYKDGQIFRMNSSDFATILPNVTIDTGEDYAQQLTSKFNEYQQASELDSIAYTGIVAFSWQSPLGELLALADTAISVAQTQNINAWFTQQDTELLEDSNANYGNQNWRQEIDNVIENKNVSLLVQPIQASARNAKIYGEILVRFLNSNDEILPTASFIAMAERLDRIVAVDRLIIETALSEIKSKNLLDKSFGVNISARSISDEHFLIWLERKLLKENKIAPRLVFEITEYGLQQNIKNSKRFIDMLHRSGARVTVERFGVGLTSFKFFRDLRPDFIKMDSTYTRDIDEDKNNQYFLRLMVDLAHRISINVLAESVETIEEKNTLEKLFIDGCQGYYINKPTPI